MKTDEKNKKNSEKQELPFWCRLLRNIFNQLDAEFYYKGK